MRNRVITTVIVLGVVLSACNARDEPDTTADAAAEIMQDSGMQSMKGMEGMGGMMAMMNQMQAHMRMIQGAAADSMKAMLPEHRQIVANMISQMNSEMRGMSMKADTAWQATIDSLRQDLVRMPEMSAAELHAFMPRHGARMMRLMDAHRRMMGG